MRMPKFMPTINHKHIRRDNRELGSVQDCTSVPGIEDDGTDGSVDVVEGRCVSVPEDSR